MPTLKDAHAPLRSMLFVSGEKPERFQKALSSGADLVCIDLEDAVHPASKAKARKEVFDFLSLHCSDQTPTRLAIRLNGLRTFEGFEDLKILIGSNIHIDYLLLPKVECPSDLELIHTWAGNSFDGLVALIETPRGIQQIENIASAKQKGAYRLRALMLGGADLSVELGAAFDWSGLLYARGRIVNTARAAGLDAWDVPHLDLSDLEGLTRETKAILKLGFSCKTAIHPVQIDVIHRAFIPETEELEWAQTLLEGYAAEEAKLGARGAFLFRGKLVDPPLLAKARRIVDISLINSGEPSALPGRQ